MKRSLIGPILLIGLLILGLAVEKNMEQTQQPIARMLDMAAGFAQTEDWTRAEESSRMAKEQWEQSWKISAALADHEPMEEIDSLFARMEVFTGEDAQEFAAVCRELSRRVEAMAQAHSLDWWNIL